MARKFYKTALCEYEDERSQLTCNGALSPEQFVSDIVKAAAGVLMRDPAGYRAFGPYWWLMKSLMLKQGIASFGQFIDYKWFRRCDYGSDADNAFAAWLYYNQSLEEGRQHQAEHTVFFAQNESTGSYTQSVYRLTDRDMERLCTR